MHSLHNYDVLLSRVIEKNENKGDEMVSIMENLHMYMFQ